MLFVRFCGLMYYTYVLSIYHSIYLKSLYKIMSVIGETYIHGGVEASEYSICVLCAIVLSRTSLTAKQNSWHDNCGQASNFKIVIFTQKLNVDLVKGTLFINPHFPPPPSHAHHLYTICPWLSYSRILHQFIILLLSIVFKFTYFSRNNSVS